ncbi:MAG: hypothetical protein ACE5JE_03310 [Thermoplasmata archaeon]
MGPPVIVCLLALFLLVLSPMARAQTQGVTVINVAPELQRIDLGVQSGVNHVDVIVSDDNSWGDILRVDLEILDELQAPVGHVVLQTYLTNVSAIWEPTFTDSLGQILVRDQSLATANQNPQTVAERSELRVTFAIQPLVGRWLRITATDLDGLNATAQLDYFTGTLGGPTVLPPWLLLLLAVAASVVLVGRRIRGEIHGG